MIFVELHESQVSNTLHGFVWTLVNITSVAGLLLVCFSWSNIIYIMLIFCSIIFFFQALHWLTSLGGSHHTNPSLHMYNVFLNGCAETQSITHAFSCLKLMEERLMGKSEITYWELLRVCIMKNAYIIDNVVYRNMVYKSYFFIDVCGGSLGSCNHGLTYHLIFYISPVHHHHHHRHHQSLVLTMLRPAT